MKVRPVCVVFYTCGLWSSKDKLLFEQTLLSIVDEPSTVSPHKAKVTLTQRQYFLHVDKRIETYLQLADVLCTIAI